MYPILSPRHSSVPAKLGAKKAQKQECMYLHEVLTFRSKKKGLFVFFVELQFL